MMQVNNLSYTYPKSKIQAVSNLGFEVRQGEIFGFLGPSGAGKSTTQKILIGLMGTYQGDISIMGKNLKYWAHSYYDHIGVCFELPNHYLKLSAVENLKFFSTFYNVPTRNPLELLKMVGLEEDAGKKVESFSKGMKMRLNFIRSLLHDPQVLFLDEPTSGLDPVNARNIKNIILEQKSKGKTIFLTTHNMHDADELCDRVAFIAEGKTSAIDSPKQLKLQNGKRTVRIEYSKNGVAEQKIYEMNGIGNNSEFLEILRNNHLISIHSEEATLDDVFIKVTGKRLNHQTDNN
ncbi:MAG: ABC transporter ATP-binding protein [Bacteroidales bacterium]|nr:ABC transporter ATP-binding protein [Bacteroidales bacterium]